MIRDQLTQLLDLLYNQRLKVENIPFTKERTKSFTTRFMDTITGRGSYATRNPQGPQLVAILISEGG